MFLHLKLKKVNGLALKTLQAMGSVTLKFEVCDIFENTPLHVACQKGASLQVIRMLVKMHPSAVIHRNANGLLPVDIIQRLPAPATNDVWEFLTEKTRDQLQNQSAASKF